MGSLPASGSTLFHSALRSGHRLFQRLSHKILAGHFLQRDVCDGTGHFDRPQNQMDQNREKPRSGGIFRSWSHNLGVATFLENGEPVNFISDDRFEFVDGKMIQCVWQTRVSRCNEMGGYRLGKNADLVYTHPKGDFCYGKFEMTNLQYHT